MSDVNHYQTLGLAANATAAEIKRAYRALAKQFHPDRYDGTDESANHDRIVAINVAYEILGDQQRRQQYDSQRFCVGSRQHTPPHSDRQSRSHSAQSQYRQQRSIVNEDEQIQEWLEQIYDPIDRLILKVLKTYKGEINALAADPFDDELLTAFQTYLEHCSHYQAQAEHLFQSRSNPSQVAALAASLYYCLSHLGDGLKELGYFTTSYDENYLYTGREMFRLAAQLRQEVQQHSRRLRL